MKKALLTAMVLTALLVAVPAAAQEEAMTDEQLIELVRSNIKKDRVAIIGAAMDFDSDEAAKFWPIYKDYEAKTSKIGDQRVALIHEYADSLESMTDGKAKALAMKAMDIETRRMKLKHECVEKLSSEISPIVAARFLQIESQLTMLLDLQIAQDMPLIGKP